MIDANITIDTDQPIPTMPFRAKYPFAMMKLGDSFFTKNARAATAAYAFSHYHRDVKFTTRKVDGGLRIWRTA